MPDAKMKFRKLRIAWSVLFGVACVLLIVLWIRSYWWSDHYHLQAGRLFGGVTNRGRMALHWLDTSNGKYGGETGYHCYAINLVRWKDEERATHPLYWYRLVTVPEGYWLVVPIWFPAIVILFLAGAPWVRRFTLRTLLIATTLVAVVLGLAVYATKK